MNRFPSYLILCSLIGLLFLSSCKTSKIASKTTTTKTTAAPVITDTFMKELAGRKHSPKFLQASAQVNADMNGENYNVTAQIKMLKDELIWVSVKKFGLEVARVFITRDSVIALNRIERTYLANSMMEFGKSVGFPLNIHLIQELLLGNIIIQPSVEFCQEEKTRVTTLRGRDDNFLSVITLLPPKFFLDEMELKDHHAERSLNSKYIQYQLVKDDKYFSYLRTYELKSEKDDQLNVEIKFNQVDWDTPFDAKVEIPGRYRKI